MHGLGNDFVIIDATQHPVSLSKETICKMADRHRGIGFDQLLLIKPPPHAGVDFAYQIFNADGNEVEQCGNGARCFGRYVYERGLTQKRQLTIATKARDLELDVHEDGQVTVDMGQPVFEPSQIPFVAPAEKIVYTLALGSDIGDVIVAVVNLGNPHVVLIVESIDTALVDAWGKRMQQHECFPQQVNVGFMEIVNRTHIKLRVYERGAGETLACGSGACAAVVAGRRQNLLEPEVRVTLRGGNLKIVWENEQAPVLMTGPGVFTFEGKWF